MRTFIEPIRHVMLSNCTFYDINVWISYTKYRECRSSSLEQVYISIE